MYTATVARKISNGTIFGRLSFVLNWQMDSVLNWRMDSVLNWRMDSVLNGRIDSVLNVRMDSVLNVRMDSVLNWRIDRVLNWRMDNVLNFLRMLPVAEEMGTKYLSSSIQLSFLDWCLMDEKGGAERGPPACAYHRHFLLTCYVWFCFSPSLL